MLTLLVYLLIFLVVCSLVYWVIGQLALPQPVRLVAVVVMALVAIVFLLQLIYGVHGLALR